MHHHRQTAAAAAATTVNAGEGNVFVNFLFEAWRVADEYRASAAAAVAAVTAAAAAVNVDAAIEGV